MKIGIDASYLKLDFDGGKDQYLFNLLEGFEKIGRGKFFVIFCLGEIKNKIKKIIPSANIKIIEIKKITGREMTDSLIFRSFYYRKIREKENIDLIFFPKSGTGFLKTDARSVVIPHDIQMISFPERFSKKLVRREKLLYYFDFKLRDKIIGISDFDKKQIEGYYPKYRNKIIRQYNPIKIEKNFIGKRKDEKYILAINIMYPHKNIITLIKSFELIKDKIPHKLYLVGKKNDYVNELEEYVKSKKLDDRIIFKGFVTENKLNDLLENANIYINPTLFEGFGMTAIEAMIKEVPTIVSDITANKEVTMGMCKYYNNPKDIEELSAEILNVLEDKKYKENLGEISKIIEKEYNYKKISRDYFNLFKNIIEGNYE